MMRMKMKKLIYNGGVSHKEQGRGRQGSSVPCPEQPLCRRVRALPDVEAGLCWAGLQP